HPADRRVRHAAGVSRLALCQRLQPVRADLPGQRPGGVVVPHAAGADRAPEDAQCPRRDGAARLGAARQQDLRTGSGDALQRLSGRRDQRRPLARPQLGAGAECDCRPARAHAAQRDDLRVDRARVSGRGIWQHDVPDLPALRAARLRRAGGAVRELVAAAHRDPDRADDPAVGDCRRLAHRRRQQRLHADQLSRPCRPRLQERDPDRRVRPAARVGGRVAAHRDPRCLPHPAAAGADDLGGVHHGRRAAGAGGGARRRGAPGDGDCGLRRDARRHPVRPVPDAGLLRRDSGPGGPPGQPARRGDRHTAAGRSGGALIMASHKAMSRLGAQLRIPIVAGFVSLQAAACAVKTAPPPTTLERAPLSRWDASAFSEQEYDPRWWRQFEDPVLEQLEHAALDANRDVRSALARFDQSRAVFDEDRRRRYPTVTAGAFVDVREQAQPGFVDVPGRVNTYRAALDMSWELDLFGRVRAAIAAASANAESFEAALAAVRVSVAAEVALNYFELRGIQQQLSVLDRSLTNQRETRRLTEVRRDAGFGEEQDVASAAARVSAIEAAVPPLRTALAAREHRLAVLIGRAPGQLTVDLAPRAYPVLAKSIPLGPPDELLNRRPDVRAAERRLASTAAREGVATADLYPRITISGMLGLLAGRGNIFGTSDSRAWAVTPALQWSAFDLGSARARLRGAKAATQEGLADYEQTMLLALEETETALVSYRQRQERLVKLTDEVRESARAAGIARVRYREGVADFLSLLDAERTELQAEDSAAQAEADVFTGIVGLYRAVGGMK